MSELRMDALLGTLCAAELIDYQWAEGVILCAKIDRSMATQLKATRPKNRSAVCARVWSAKLAALELQTANAQDAKQVPTYHGTMCTTDDDGEGRWLKGLPAGQGVEQRVRQQEWNKELVIYCHNLLETHEDVFHEAIRDDVGANGAARSELCVKLGVCASKHDEL